MKKKFIFTLLIFISSNVIAKADLIAVSSGAFHHFDCASVRDAVDGVQKAKSNDFKRDYYEEMSYTVYRNSDGDYYLRTALYRGLFKDVSNKMNKLIFVQIYNGSDVAIISMKGDDVIYTNNGSSINRLCKAEIVLKKEL